MGSETLLRSVPDDAHHHYDAEETTNWCAYLTVSFHVESWHRAGKQILSVKKGTDLTSFLHLHAFHHQLISLFF